MKAAVTTSRTYQPRELWYIALFLAFLVILSLFATTAPTGLDRSSSTELKPGQALVVGHVTPLGFRHRIVAIMSREGRFTVGVSSRINLNGDTELLDTNHRVLFKITWPNGRNMPPTVTPVAWFTGVDPLN